MSKRAKVWAFIAALVSSSLYHSCGISGDYAWILAILQEDLFG
jgi:hypothetical protein